MQIVEVITKTSLYHNKRKNRHEKSIIDYHSTNYQFYF